MKQTATNLSIRSVYINCAPKSLNSYVNDSKYNRLKVGSQYDATHAMWGGGGGGGLYAPMYV